MKALTLIRPWTWALFHGKPVENRTWPLPEKYLGERIAIHAGMKWDPEGASFCTLQLGPLPEIAHATGIIGTLIFDRVAYSLCMDAEQDPIIASSWFFGPYGFVHSGAVELRRPVLCRGAQGLWTLPADVERQVVEQLGGAS
jgi:hypothetical protein